MSIGQSLCHHYPPQYDKTSLAQPGGESPPRSCEVLHIGCICILLEAPSEQPGPRVLRSNIPTLIATTKGLQNAIPNNQTSQRYTRKASTPHLQAVKHTSEHIPWSTDHMRIFLRHAVMRVLDNS